MTRSNFIVTSFVTEEIRTGSGLVSPKVAIPICGECSGSYAANRTSPKEGKRNPVDQQQFDRGVIPKPVK
jgi:hypothetical protein